MSTVTHSPVIHSVAVLPSPDAPLRVSVAVRIATMVVILVPLLAVVAGPFLVWGWGFGWTDMSLLIGMYVLTALGITVGFHRLFVHRSFESPTWLKFIIAAFGSMAVQGSLFQWVGTHRRHHQHSDTPDDPHTPHHHGTGVAGLLKGFWHAHVGWFFRPDSPELGRYIKDLKASPTLRVADAMFVVWVAVGLLLPGLLGGLITGTWAGVWTGLIWGGLVRLFLVHHVTWSINSACHLWGLRPYKSDDHSRDNIVFGILGMGEGWHNTHHAFPTSARHGLNWWKLDLSYWVIRSLWLVGLAWNVRLPSKEAQLRERRLAA